MRDDESAGGSLFSRVYEQLRIVARRRMTMERAGGAGHTLQPTAVVHEAYARLARAVGPLDEGGVSEREFFLAATREIERVLVDHARRKFAEKRGGDPAATGRVRIPLDVLDLAGSEDPAPAMALGEALLRLEQEDAQAAAVVRLRFFAGLSNPEVAQALGISERTAVRDWTFARAYLAAELAGEESGAEGSTA